MRQPRQVEAPVVKANIAVQAAKKKVRTTKLHMPCDALNQPVPCSHHVWLTLCSQLKSPPRRRWRRPRPWRRRRPPRRMAMPRMRWGHEACSVDTWAALTTDPEFKAILFPWEMLSISQPTTTDWNHTLCFPGPVYRRRQEGGRCRVARHRTCLTQRSLDLLLFLFNSGEYFYQLFSK